MKQRPDSWNKIYSRVLAAERDFGLLRRGDRILLGVSGGRDSLVLLDMLAYQQRVLSRTLGLAMVAVHVPGRYHGRPIAPAAKLQALCGRLGVPFVCADQELTDDTFHDCFTCARARRKILFDLADRHGCGTIALGHNADDMVETALLNILYAGHFAALHPRQPLLDGKVTVIRPLAYVWKDQITAYCGQRFGPLRQFRCPGSARSKRIAIRALLNKLERGGAPVKANILKAITNPKPEYLPLRGT